MRGTLDNAQLADARSAPARSFSALDLLRLLVAPVCCTGGPIGPAVARLSLSRARAPEKSPEPIGLEAQLAELRHLRMVRSSEQMAHAQRGRLRFFRSDVVPTHDDKKRKASCGNDGGEVAAVDVIEFGVRKHTNIGGIVCVAHLSLQRSLEEAGIRHLHRRCCQDTIRPAVIAITSDGI